MAAAHVDDLFQLAPISLWLEDFSAVKQQFDTWRAEGIEDLEAWLASRPEQVAAAVSLIRVLDVNQRTLDLFEARSADELVSRLADIFRDDMLIQHARDLACLWRGEGGFSSRGVNYTLTGKRLDVEVRARVLPGAEADWSKVLFAIDDVTARMKAQRALEDAQQYAVGLFQHSPVSLWVEDFRGVKRLIDDVRANGIQDFRTFLDVHPDFIDRCLKEIVVIDVNQQTLRMFGADSKTQVLDNLGRIFRDDMRTHFLEQLVDLWNGVLFQQRETINYSLNGQTVHVHMQFSVLPGHEDHWELVQVALTDITARKRAEAYLEYLGRHDVLTKLHNRAFFDEETARLIRKGTAPISIIIADLNGLKAANDSLGHAAGDDLLRRAGEALLKAVGEGICAARIGGDEFAVLLPGIGEEEVRQIVDRIQVVVDMNNQFYTGPRLSFAMGMATAPSSSDLKHMIQRADEAMYRAKRAHYERLARE